MFEKNLKFYRLKRKMTKKDLADACDVTPMAITNYESGKRKPDMETVKKLASALGVKTIDFLQTRNDQLKFNHFEFRKKSSLSKAEQEFIRESVEEYFSRFFETLEILGGDPLPKPIVTHKINRSGDYDRDARELRKYLNLQKDGPIEEIICMLENKGILVFEIDIDNDSFSGMNGTVNGYSYIVINKNMRPERKRTTIIHELAHIMFDWSGSTDESEIEKEATAIAGSFLISNEDIVRELGLKRYRITRDFVMVCEEYGISLFLLVKRASQAGVISEGLEKQFYIAANKNNFKENENSRVKNPEEPLLLKQLVLRAIYVEGINIQKAAELLNQSVSEVKQYYDKMEVSG